MSPPSCATAGRTRVSISSLIWSMMSASAGSSSKSASSATWMPAARAGREQRRAADEMVEQGLEHQRLEIGPRHARRRGHRDEVAAVEHAFDHAAVEQGAAASGEASAASASAKSRVPASMTVWPGRNLRVAGLGVCSVRISMGAMWPCRPVCDQGPKGGAPATIQRVIADARRRGRSARPTICRAASARRPGSSAARPVIIGLVSCLPRKPVEDDRGDMQDDQRRARR